MEYMDTKGKAVQKKHPTKKSELQRELIDEELTQHHTADGKLA